MFSITTMASSTTKPVEIVSAISDKLSSVYPHIYITPNVPTSDRGTAILGMAVAQMLRRKKKTTRITRTMERTSVSCTSFTEARIVTERSCAMAILIDGGMEGWRRGV